MNLSALYSPLVRSLALASGTTSASIGRREATPATALLDAADRTTSTLMERLETRIEGLTGEEVRPRRALHGRNEVVHERRGREVYGNIVKYIKMTASSNFGNVFSVLIASAVLPFLPMLSVQLLIQNLLYDFSQLSLPWDRMDPEFLTKPRRWDATESRDSWRSSVRSALCST